MANTNLPPIIVKHFSRGIGRSGKHYINLFIIIIIIWSIGRGGLGICAFCYM